MPPVVEIARREAFSAAHRLHSPVLSAEDNAALFGKVRRAGGARAADGSLKLTTTRIVVQQCQRSRTQLRRDGDSAWVSVCVLAPKLSRSLSPIESCASRRPVDPATGMVINLTTLAAALKRVVETLDHKVSASAPAVAQLTHVDDDLSHARAEH